MAIDNRLYLGRSNLRGLNAEFDVSPEDQQEYFKCLADPFYFFENFVHIITENGKVKFKPRDYQVRLAKEIIENRFTLAKMPRQYGKTTIVAAIILWYVLFHQDYKICILAHKEKQAMEVLDRVQMAYEMLPLWMQQGVKSWNKGSIELENGSKVETEATSAGGIRGKTFQMVYMDEFAHVDAVVQEQFYTSTYPTITAGTKTKMCITSTPNGLEMFYRLWKESLDGGNDFRRVECHWRDIPGRDDQWREETIRRTSARQFEQEFETEFLGSSDTLIDGKKLAVIPMVKPINEQDAAKSGRDELLIWEKPQHGHVYVCCVDTGRGKGLDYSAFLMIDVSVLPYKVCARFRSNEIHALQYPTKVLEACRLYNSAFCLVETNDVGKQTADILAIDLQYENMFTAQTKGRNGQQLGGMGTASRDFGVRTTQPTKKIGCLQLKTLVETDRLILNDVAITTELSTFIAKKTGWAADSGKHDDLVMCLVLFGWLVNQDYFKELTSFDIRKEIEQKNNEFRGQDLTPFLYQTSLRSPSDYVHGGNYKFSDPDFGEW